MDTCIFCKIILKEIPKYYIYEDDSVVAFLDIHPTQKGHTLIIPKKHSDTFLETDDAVLAHSACVAKKIGKALKDAVGADGVNIITNNGLAAGQIVSHLHTHIIPRFIGDGLMHWPGGTYSSGEEQDIAEAIKKSL